LKLLLHVCCAPDLTISYKKLKALGYEPIVYFYNPNIYPEEEYIKRFNEVKKLQMVWNFELIEGEYEPSIYFERIKGHEFNKYNRCLECIKLRLENSLIFANEYRFSQYTSSLLASPRKSHNDILNIVKKIELSNKNIRFQYINFRSNNGIKESSKMCKTYNIYRQDYCGCAFSLSESKKYEEESRRNNYEELKKVVGEDYANAFFNYYKTDLLRIPEDIPYEFLVKEGINSLKYLKPQIVLIRKEIASDFGILKSGRYKIGDWKTKIIVW